MGRPSLYSPELVESICERLRTGEPLAQICRDEGMPHRSVVYDWEKDKPDVSLHIARAREDGEETIAASCLEIADDSRNDYIAVLAQDGDEKAILASVNGEVIQRSRLRVDTRLKLLAKWNPSKWGDKSTTVLTGKDGAALMPSVIEIVGVLAK